MLKYMGIKNRSHYDLLKILAIEFGYKMVFNYHSYNPNFKYMIFDHYKSEAKISSFITSEEPITPTQIIDRRKLVLGDNFIRLSNNLGTPKYVIIQEVISEDICPYNAYVIDQNGFYYLVGSKALKPYKESVELMINDEIAVQVNKDSISFGCQVIKEKDINDLIKAWNSMRNKD